jgi:acetyltransferase-like isoleucine patch superfamily enzyme
MSRGTNLARRLIGLAADPARALALLRGRWYKAIFRLRGLDFRAGPRLHAYGRIRIRGAVRVVIGAFATIRGELRIEDGGEITIGDFLESSGSFRISGGGRVALGDRLAICDGLRLQGPGAVRTGAGVTVWEESVLHTHTPEAQITIGEGTKMLGAYLSCAREIVVGRECLIAPSRILDSDFHSTRPDRHSENSLVRVAPVHLEDNVWIGERAALLAGTRVGRNSVVGFGAVCMRDFPADVIILGNPARVSAPIPEGDRPETDRSETDRREPVPYGIGPEGGYVTRGYLTGRHGAHERP